MKISIIIHRIYRYVRYWLLKMDQHGLQSPFVYGFYTNCLQPRATDLHVNEDIEQIRRELMEDQTASVSGLIGKGSSMGVVKGKKISKIAKYGISDLKQSSLLANILVELEAASVLELGTSLGINTLYMSLVNGVEEVTTIEGNVELAEISQCHFDQLASVPIETLVGDIDEQLAQLVEQRRRYDLIYIDANHTYEATLNYYQTLNALTDVNSVLIFDDINWSSGMTKAWEEIKSNSEKHLTIENYNLGIIFLNPDLESKNYVLDF